MPRLLLGQPKRLRQKLYRVLQLSLQRFRALRHPLSICLLPNLQRRLRVQLNLQQRQHNLHNLRSLFNLRNRPTRLHNLHG